MRMSLNKVKVSEVIEKMDLVLLTRTVDVSKVMITRPDINRPALQLTGFYDYFEHSRVQIVGAVEQAYIEGLDEETRHKRIEVLMEHKIPAIIFARNMQPDKYFIEMGEKYGVPILVSGQSTSDVSSELIRWLKVKLAPSITIHGVLVDVYGEGVLITGESGIGKSEAALELIKRGHRLVSDDVVEIHKVSDETLIGSAPAITKHLIELRGIGIIDVKTLFGVESVKDTQAINMVIHLEDWKKDKEYDRLGLEEKTIEYLGNRVVCHDIPIRPGRNLAVIVECAAVNHRQKAMGYNAAEELYRRVQQNLSQGAED